MIQHPPHNLEYWREHEHPRLKWMLSHINYITSIINEQVNTIGVNSSNWYKLRQEKRAELNDKYKLDELTNQYREIHAGRAINLYSLSQNITFIPSNVMIHLITSKVMHYYSYGLWQNKYAMGALYPFSDKLKSFGFETLIQMDKEEYTLSANCYRWMFYSIRCRITPADILASCKSRDLPRQVFNYEFLNYVEG